MTSRVVRLILFVVFVAGVGAAAYFVWTGESQARASREAARIFDQQTRLLMRGVLDLRAAQQGYVSAGQGDEFWAAKVSGLITSLRNALIAARQFATVAAQSHLDEASSFLNDFEQMDRRAREYARSGQRLLASDLIFSDGFERTEGALEAIERAHTVELQARTATIDEVRRNQMLEAGGAAVLGLLVALMLAPVPAPKAPDTPGTLFDAPSPTLLDDDRPLKPVADVVTPPERPVVEPPPALPPIDLFGIASVCNDLARVSDTRALPGLLERAAAVLDAAGIIMWIADPDGRELNPIVAHGYPAQLVTRLGTIARDAENATAAAFRTGLLQTVDADAVSNGAIAAPLVTPAGCVGVMAAEVRSGGEKQNAKLAAAAIVAAQLATLVGPPSARAQGKVEATGA